MISFCFFIDNSGNAIAIFFLTTFNLYLITLKNKNFKMSDKKYSIL